LDFGVGNWGLISNIGLVNVITFGEGDLEHGHDSAVLELIKSFDKGLELINNGDIADLVDLVETFNSVLHELSEVYSRLNCI
jgi:hypothetical protein